jgi:3-methyladenine DNA glycosylase AlkD
MPTAASIMAELKKKGSAQTQKTYARHGMAIENTFGASIADLKGIAKTIRGKQALACDSTKPGRWRRCTWPRWWRTAGR